MSTFKKKCPPLSTEEIELDGEEEEEEENSGWRISCDTDDNSPLQKEEDDGHTTVYDSHTTVYDSQTTVYDKRLGIVLDEDQEEEEENQGDEEHTIIDCQVRIVLPGTVPVPS